MAGNVLSSPLALIKKDGNVIGLMRDVQVTESVRRTPIRGLGALTPKEVPAVEWEGRLTCSFYMVDLKQTGIPDAVKRDINEVQKFVDNVILQDTGVDIVLFKKEKIGVDGDGNVLPALTELGTVKGLFFTSDGINLSDGQISGRNQEFVYIYPILEQI
jgi:hypothetical protein